jgi:EAL domain-containing protein (putative c-di-GMP-specific phosphodiesterase class I)
VLTDRPPRQWAGLLDLALALGGVRSHYQPIVDLARGAVVGYEALARFAPGTAIGTEQWFATARELGRVAELEAAALRSALVHRADLPVNTFLTVNLGPDVLDHPAVREVLAAEVSLAGVVVELTEHARIDSYAALEPAIDRLRGAGAMLAIDDAGSGYAGLQHLVTLRPDIIKLDRGLIAGVDRDEAKRALVEMVGTFASRIDAWLLGEGVETRAELETLTRLGVPLAQGYYLGRPAEPWSRVDGGSAAFVRSLHQPDATPTLRSLLEEVPTTVDAVEAAAEAERARHDHVMLVDVHGRAVAAFGTTGTLLSVHHALLQVNVDTPVSQAAQRALTRAPERRFRPLVCTDDAGRFVGMVRMERVVGFLAAEAEAPQGLATLPEGQPARG